MEINCIIRELGRVFIMRLRMETLRPHLIWHAKDIASVSLGEYLWHATRHIGG